MSCFFLKYSSIFISSFMLSDFTVFILKVNVNESPAIAKAENVRIVPTFKIYKDGMKMKEMICPSQKVLEVSVRHYSILHWNRWFIRYYLCSPTFNSYKCQLPLQTSHIIIQQAEAWTRVIEKSPFFSFTFFPFYLPFPHLVQSSPTLFILSICGTWSHFFCSAHSLVRLGCS